MKSIKKTKSSLHAAVLAGPITALLTLALGAGSALATDGAWGVNSSGNWSDATKWAGGINIADGVGATADLSGSVISSSNKTITMDSARTLGKVMLGASSRNLDIATGSNILTLDDTFNAGTNPLGDNVVEITYRAGSGRNGSIGVPIELKNNLLISNPDNTGNTGILISGGLSSSNGNLTITNNSNLNSRTKFNSTVSDGAPGNSITYIQTVGWTEFNNPNTFTGTTTNVAGSIVLRNSLALQNSALDTAASGVGNGADPGNGLKIKVAALTLGGLIGNKDLASLFNTALNASHNDTYAALTALTLNPGTGKNYTYSGAIGNGAAGMTLTKTGAGTQILSGTNTYTGATTLSAGTLSAGVSANLGDAASNLVFNGGTLQITGTTLTNFSGIGHTVSFNAGQTVGLDIDNAANIFTVDQVLDQTAGGFTKLGAGTADLNLNNTYTGTTNVNAGTLNVNGTLGAGANAVNVNAGAKLKFGSVSQTLGSLTIGAGATVTFTSGLASGAFSGGGKTPSFGGATAVPEPGTLGMLLVGALGVLNRRRRLA